MSPAGLHDWTSRTSYGGEHAYDPVLWTIRCRCGWVAVGLGSQDATIQAHNAHVEARRKGPVEARFLAFHADYPEVYDALVELARKAYDAGANRVGLRMLLEVLRWEWTLSRLPADDEAWKLNNNYAPWYARLIMNTEPWATGLFELRQMRTP